MSRKSSGLSGFIAANLPAQDAGKLEKVRAKAGEARELEREIADLEERVAEKKKTLNAVLEKELVDLMDEAGVDALGIEASGNLPAVDLEVKPFYRASIAADWEDAKREAGFKALEEVGAGDLVKRTFTIAFPKGAEAQKEAKALRDFLLDSATPFNEKLDVHFMTLTSWLKETHQREGELPDLDKIGGQIGRVVKIKARKEK